MTVRNVLMQSDGKVLRITIDLSKEFGPSSSGKTTIVASTGGSVDVPGSDGTKVGINVYKK